MRHSVSSWRRSSAAISSATRGSDVTTGTGHLPMDRCAPRRAASRSRRSPVVCSTFSASHGAPADCTGLAAGRATGHPQTPQRAAQRRTGARAGQRAPTGTPYLATHMAKDTEKLIRQLSLISYLMAERRPVTALEIRRDVEGYSGMNEDAFARRFYADRAELESLGHPPHGRAAASTASPSRRTTRCAPRTSTCRRSPSPTRSWPRCSSRSRCSTASSPTPSRCAWRCSRSPGAGRARCARPTSARSRSASPARPAATSSRSAWPRSRRRSSATRRSPSTTTRWSATRPARARSTPTTCSSRAASSTCSAARTSATRCASSACRASAGKVAYATKAEHDFKRPADFDPRAYANRAEWQYGERRRRGDGLGLRPHRLAGRAPLRALRRRSSAAAGGGRTSTPPYATARQLASWVLSLGEHARVVGPPELVEAVDERIALLAARHEREPELAPALTRRPRRGQRRRRRTAPSRRRPDAARRRSAPSASRASSRWPRSSSTPGAPALRLPRRRRAASACSSPSPSCARTSTCSTS